MDVWVVAAAAGAGYVAQRLKNLTKGKGKHSCSENLNFVSSTESSSIIREKVQDKSCPFRRVSFGEGMPKDDSAAEMGVFEGENLVMLENSLDGFLKHEDFQADLEGSSSSSKVFSDISDVHSLPYGLRRNRSSSIRSRRIKTKLIKPQISLQSCLMAQLYKEHVEIEEEYTYSLHPLKEPPTTRPFLVSDGSRIISRGPHEYESFSEPTGTGGRFETVIGVPRLPNIVPVELNKKAKARKANEPDLSMANGNHSNAQGSSDRALLFYLGLTMGIVSSFSAYKREMEKLNKLLKQTENLVQDLHEELEMKDSLTVKELAVEDYNEYCYFDEQRLDDSSRYCNDPKNRAEEESLSKIEAELEAELERLETNMKSSRLQGKLSELNRDFVSDVIEGELFGAKTGKQPYRDGSGSSTTPFCGPVSPKELSLRLHQVIQSRLEERVKELETALHNKCIIIESSSSSSSSFSSSSSSIIDIDNIPRPPVVINLSGEALGAYNEAYQDLTKVSEEDNLDLGFENGYMMERHLVSNNNNTMSNQSEEDDDDDEMERLLIKQIIEKAKQGSPAVFKAQRAFLSTDDESEH